MTTELKDELRKLSFEVRDLSKEIGALKGIKNESESKEERLKLREVIKQKQYQALFYIEKIGNPSKELDKRG